jgi:CheY-like chemotaxis protein
MSEHTSDKKAIVLLVEDEPMICDIAAEALQEQGFQVWTASTASEALDYLATGSPIDVLFTDVNLRDGMDGGALARRARELRPGLPVMYTSGRRSTIEGLVPVEDAIFLPKPYNPFDLGPLLEHLVARRFRRPRMDASGR